jgi:hypothetical protein
MACEIRYRISRRDWGIRDWYTWSFTYPSVVEFSWRKARDLGEQGMGPARPITSNIVPIALEHLRRHFPIIVIR